jgi:hypothetical protein
VPVELGGVIVSATAIAAAPKVKAKSIAEAAKSLGIVTLPNDRYAVTGGRFLFWDNFVPGLLCSRPFDVAKKSGQSFNLL